MHGWGYPWGFAETFFGPLVDAAQNKRKTKQQPRNKNFEFRRRTSRQVRDNGREILFASKEREAPPKRLRFELNKMDASIFRARRGIAPERKASAWKWKRNNWWRTREMGLNLNLARNLRDFLISFNKSARSALILHCLKSLGNCMSQYIMETFKFRPGIFIQIKFQRKASIYWLNVWLASLRNFDEMNHRQESLITPVDSKTDKIVKSCSSLRVCWFVLLTPDFQHHTTFTSRPRKQRKWSRRQKKFGKVCRNEQVRRSGYQPRKDERDDNRQRVNGVLKWIALVAPDPFIVRARIFHHLRDLIKLTWVDYLNWERNKREGFHAWTLRTPLTAYVAAHI